MKNVLWFVFFIVVYGYADRPRFDNEEDDKLEFDNEAGDVSPVESDSIVKKIQKLIKYGGVEENKEKIQKESSHLSFRKTELLYDENRKRGAAAWGWVNFYGIGSFLQGDIKAGIIVAGLELSGGFLNIYLNEKRIDEGCNGKNTERPFEHAMSEYEECRNELGSDGMTPLSMVFVGAGWIYGIVAPILYQSKYNKALREALSLNDKISFSIDPLIIPKDRAPAVGLAFNLRY
jgi:hypothetical protein